MPCQKPNLKKAKAVNIFHYGTGFRLSYLGCESSTKMYQNEEVRVLYHSTRYFFRHKLSVCNSTTSIRFLSYEYYCVPHTNNLDAWIRIRNDQETEVSGNYFNICKIIVVTKDCNCSYIWIKYLNVIPIFNLTWYITMSITFLYTHCCNSNVCVAQSPMFNACQNPFLVL